MEHEFCLLCCYLKATMGDYFDNCDDVEHRNQALDQLFSGGFEEDMASMPANVLDRGQSYRVQYTGIDDTYAR